MLRVAIADLDRPGLPDALAARGMACAGPDGEGQGFILGWASAPMLVADRIDRLRARGIGPVLVVLPALGLFAPGEAEIIAALDAGADDAAPDSVSDAMIAARLAALLRARAPVIRVGGLTIDPVDRRVRRDGRDIALLPREYRLLTVLARRPGEVVDRATLLDQVCGIGFDPGTNVIDVHISRLRAKLDRGFAVPMLLTEKRRGFRLVAG